MTSLVTQGNDDFQGLERKNKNTERKSSYVCLRKCDETEKRKKSTEAESPFNHTPSHTQKWKKMHQQRKAEWEKQNSNRRTQG